MSDADDSGLSIPIPNENAPVSWSNVSIEVDFYPGIKLSRKAGLEFTAELSDAFEPENVVVDGAQWKISGGGVCEGIQLIVDKRQIEIRISDPQNPLEWYEKKLATLLRVFEEKFEPKVALQSLISAAGLVQLPGEDADARAFLGGYVMLMHPSKVECLNHPNLHLVGLRFAFTPDDKHEWGVNVRVESAALDHTKIYLSAEAGWEQQSRWDDQFIETTVGRIGIVSRFVSERLIEFLRKPPFPTEADEDESNE